MFETGTETILLVDDDHAIRRLAALILEAEGYKVLSATHSDEALLICDKYHGPIHLLLTDVRMDPFMDGCELAKCVRLLRPDIQVLYISGNANNHMVQHEVEVGKAIFLPKPFGPVELIETTRSVLNAMARAA